MVRRRRRVFLTWGLIRCIGVIRWLTITRCPSRCQEKYVSIKPRMEFSKSYSPSAIEPNVLQRWENLTLPSPARPEIRPPASTIVIPPPNVTGSLHMGHALNNVLQDVLIRWRRMAGDDAVWVPGTDHGGIATQTVVEKLLLAEGTTRQALGRTAFLERMWRWRQESGDTILMQLRRLGCSCDWARTRFTMDEVCSRAVMKVFVDLFHRGWIYRGRRMVNWCPRCQTALSDIEVEHEPQAGHLWHIRYPLTEATAPAAIEVVTTRPETMLGDTAVAVHPEDTRYHHWVGRQVRLPLMDRLIPVIADEAVDPSFGTGAVKVTPAHDLVDFEIGQRHGLAQEIVIDPQGRMTDRAGRYQGLDRFECRKRVVTDLKEANLLASIEDYEVSVSVCYRCLSPLEPLISDQWFLRVQEMAAQAKQAIEEGLITFHPASWVKPTLSWLEDLKDWCISRQIWWGHQIPIWYCAQSACPPFAAEQPPTRCPACGGRELRQDPDVLDTWFSSALWPFSVFGWPEQTAELQARYPTWVLVTGYEILYLWVARMIMMGLALNPTGALATAGRIPFRHVFIHGIVRDKTGKKMSKSLGNVIDPLEIMGRYGTDALRFALVTASVPGRDLQLSDDAFIGGRNFANKLWNAARFVYLNLEKSLTAGEDPWDAFLLNEDRLELADRWILS
ncbi:MAG: valine--tRNA ligase, partial [Elusimicrobia bacterium]|nr:valine--tRNA ligase [Elusimicrobiota bacterium]